MFHNVFILLANVVASTIVHGQQTPAARSICVDGGSEIREGGGRGGGGKEGARGGREGGKGGTVIHGQQPLAARSIDVDGGGEEGGRERRWTIHNPYHYSFMKSWEEL